MDTNVIVLGKLTKNKRVIKKATLVVTDFVNAMIPAYWFGYGEIRKPKKPFNMSRKQYNNFIEYAEKVGRKAANDERVKSINVLQENLNTFFKETK